MTAEAYAILFQGLKRAGPGSDKATLRALRLLPPLPKSPRVLDLGCGMGAQSLVLTAELKTPIVAVDLMGSLLAQLEETATALGLDHLITTRRADMGALEDAPGSIDLIWAENSIYSLGFAKGLGIWRTLLGPDGLAMVSDVSWTSSSPPDEARKYWTKYYPAMTTVEDNIAAAAGQGYEVLAHFALEPAGWRDEYHRPLKDRIALLRDQAARDPALSRVIEEAQEEMNLYERFGDSYGYVYYLMRKAD